MTTPGSAPGLTPQQLRAITYERVGELLRAQMTKMQEEFGTETHPDGTDASKYVQLAQTAISELAFAKTHEVVTWRHIFKQAAYELLAEESPDAMLRKVIALTCVTIEWSADLIERIGVRDAGSPKIF